MVTCAVCGKIRLEGQYTRTPLGKPVCNEKYINDCNPVCPHARVSVQEVKLVPGTCAVPVNMAPIFITTRLDCGQPVPQGNFTITFVPGEATTFTGMIPHT